jgi:hypothetical protein
MTPLPLPPEISGALSIRDLRRDPTLAPGGARFPEVIRRFLPLTHGAALALVPENAEGAEAISLSAFEALAFRARRLNRKTVVAEWLLRSVWFAAARERNRLRLSSKPILADGLFSQAALRRTLKLKAKELHPFLVGAVLNESAHAIATALRVKARKVEQRQAKANDRVSRSIKKLAAKAGKSANASEFLRALPTAPPAEVEARIVEKMAAWSPQTQRDPRVISIFSAWRWLAFGHFLKRFAIGFGVTVLTVALVVATFAFLISQGHINMAKMMVGGMQASLLKEFPGMGAVATPFPGALTQPPRNTAELYGLTNIWAAKISMTPGQWKKVQPENIPPSFGSREGNDMPLRNPKATRSGLAGVLGLDFPWSEGAFDFAGQHFPAVGVRYRGNGTFINSMYGRKQSFKIDFDRVKKDTEFAGVTSLNLVNVIPDFSYLKDALSEQLFRELGAVAPRTAYAYLTLDVPGEVPNRPLGLYSMIENIDARFAKDRFGAKAVPIFKPVTRRLFDDWGKDWNAEVQIGNIRGSYREIYDLKTKATKEQCDRVVEFAQIVTHASAEEFAQKLPDYLDLEEYAAFVAGHVLLSSYDGYLSNGQNFYLYLDPRSNKFGFIAWDQDHSFGEFGYVDTAENRETASIWHPAAYDNRFLKRVMEVESFKKIYRRKLEEALAGPFAVERMNRKIDALAAVLRPAIAAESQFRLERFEIAISTNWVSGPRNGVGDDQREGPRAPAHQLKRFVQARVQSVRDQLDGKSEGVRLGAFGNN